MSHLFNKETKSEYSWIPKGCTSPIINSTITGSLSMISAFCSNGEFLCSCYQSTVDSDVFCDFIKLLKYTLSKWNINIKSQVLIVLDNAPYHWSSKTVEFLRHHEINVQFLPPYCPSLAPVETLFKFIKSGIKRLAVENSINFKKSSGIEIIKQSWNQISDKARIAAWTSFIQEGRNWIWDAHDLEIE